MMASPRLTIVIKLGAASSLCKPGTTDADLFATGTSSIVDENTHEPILSILTLIVETVAKLHRDGHNVVLVSSGAVGVGLRRMDVGERPTNLPRIQVQNMYSSRISRDILANNFPGASGCGTVPAYESLGRIILASSGASGSDSFDQE